MSTTLLHDPHLAHLCAKVSYKSDKNDNSFQFLPRLEIGLSLVVGQGEWLEVNALTLEKP